MISFEEYLTGKKIDSVAFRKYEAERWETYRQIFEQMHPESFTTQKKFVINDLRRQYHLKEQAAPSTGTEKKVAKPVIRPSVPKPTESETGKIVSAESEKPPVIEALPPSNAEEPVKKVAKPMMRPVIKKAETTTPPELNKETADTSESAQTQLSETPKKPARPVMKPVMKKPIAESTESQPTEENREKNTTAEDKIETPAVEEKIVSEDEAKPASKPVMKKPVMRPVMKKPDSQKPTE